MSDRRMFAKAIIDSDDFLNMPLSSQCLYFHLSMRADDEGFLNNPKKIGRMVGASEDDFRVLFSKNYVIPFESGIVVIRHWKIHNYIRGDRLKSTIFQDEAEKLTVDKSGAYILAQTNDSTEPEYLPQSDSQVTVNCQSSGGQVTVTRRASGGIGKVNISKVNIGQDNIKKGGAAALSDLMKEFDFSDRLRESFEHYLSYLSEIGKPAGTETARAIVRKLNSLAKSEDEAVEMLEAAIRNRWKDIYRLNEQRPEPKRNPGRRTGNFGNYEQRDFDYSEAVKIVSGYVESEKGSYEED